MINISYKIAAGSGILPRRISRNSVLFLDASNNDGCTYNWEVLSSPMTNAVFSAPFQPSTKFGPLDAFGVYQVRLVMDDTQFKTLSFGVPETNTGLVAENPKYREGNRVRNYSFDLPGILPGWAAYWDMVDDANLLNNFAGISRGRCPSGEGFLMVLGDSNGNQANSNVGDVFSISQIVDFTDIDTLRVDLKFVKA